MTINKDILDQISMFSHILTSAIEEALEDEEIQEGDTEDEYVNPIAQHLTELKEDIEYSQDEISHWLDFKEALKELVEQEFRA